MFDEPFDAYQVIKHELKLRENAVKTLDADIRQHQAKIDDLRAQRAKIMEDAERVRAALAKFEKPPVPKTYENHAGWSSSSSHGS